MSDFADFVEKQQALRFPHKKDAPPTAPVAPAIEHHEELDILDELNLEDAEPQAPLRDLLLAPADSDKLHSQLAKLVDDRLQEGHGEAVFDIGFENNNQSMRLTKHEYDTALERLKAAADKMKAACNVLLTNYVHGNVEAESTAAAPKDGKDQYCSAKVLLRQQPASIENVIETRIAVVGNGRSQPQLAQSH